MSKVIGLYGDKMGISLYGEKRSVGKQREESVKGGQIVDRVKDYMIASRATPFPITAQEITMLSREAVAVYDNYGETDVYFDVGSYRVVHEAIWKNYDGSNTLIPPALERTGLGVLQGMGRLPPVRGANDAFEFAKQELAPRNKEAGWFKTLRRAE